jgi:hypothetical protein
MMVDDTGFLEFVHCLGYCKYLEFQTMDKVQKLSDS